MTSTNHSHKNHEPRPVQVFRAHARLLGITKGGGQLAVQILPTRLIQKNAVPPVETAKEVMESGLINRIHKSKGSVLHTDGACAGKAALKTLKSKLKHHWTVHGRKEYIKHVQSGRNLSGLTGTMSIDAAWSALKRFLPKSTNNKKNHKFNPAVWQLVWAWLWRFNCAWTRREPFTVLRLAIWQKVSSGTSTNGADDA